MDKSALQTLLIKHKSEVLINKRKTSEELKKSNEAKIRKQLKESNFYLGEKLTNQLTDLFKKAIEQCPNLSKYEVYIKLPDSLETNSSMSAALKNVLQQESNCEVIIVLRNFETYIRFTMAVP